MERKFAGSVNLGRARRVFSIFDPFVLKEAILGEPGSTEREALSALVANCPHRLLFDDAHQRLATVYQESLGVAFQRLRTSLEARMTAAKLVRGGQLARVRAQDIAGLSGQHHQFILTAVGLRPDYLVTRIRQVTDAPRVIQRVEDGFAVRVLTPGQFTTHLRSGRVEG